jgi:hypothetical protein
LGVIFSSNWPVQKNDVWALVLAPEKCANLSEVTLFTSFVQRENEMTVVFFTFRQPHFGTHLSLLYFTSSFMSVVRN